MNEESMKGQSSRVLKKKSSRVNIQEMESICFLWQRDNLPFTEGIKELCTNRSATVTRSSDTMSRAKLYKLQPGRICKKILTERGQCGSARMFAGLLSFVGLRSSGRTVGEWRGCPSVTWCQILQSDNKEGMYRMLTWTQCCGSSYGLHCNTFMYIFMFFFLFFFIFLGYFSPSDSSLMKCRKYDQKNCNQKNKLSRLGVYNNASSSVRHSGVLC